MDGFQGDGGLCTQCSDQVFACTTQVRPLSACDRLKEGAHFGRQR